MTPRQALLECGAADAGSVSWASAARHIGAEQALRCQDAVPGLASVHGAVFPYYAGDEPGNLCLYARGEDYHRVLRRRLEQAAQALRQEHPGCAFVPFADISPFPEVLLGALCGLGVRGQNGLLITSRFGSYVFVGLLASTLPWPDSAAEPGECIGCAACRRACPGGALTGDFDPERCLSHISQKRGELSAHQRALLAQSPLIWGCDRCQTVCPMNRGAEQTGLPEFRQDLILSLSERDCALSDRQFRKTYGSRAFSWRGVAPLRRNLALQEDKKE